MRVRVETSKVQVGQHGAFQHAADLAAAAAGCSKSARRNRRSTRPRSSWSTDGRWRSSGATTAGTHTGAEVGVGQDVAHRSVLATTDGMPRCSLESSGSSQLSSARRVTPRRVAGTSRVDQADASRHAQSLLGESHGDSLF